MHDLHLRCERRAEAAQALGIGLRTLQRKLREYRQMGFFRE